MSDYVAETGYAGTAYPQSLIWHYKTNISRDVLNRWFVNIFDQGVLAYTPSGTGVVGPTISAGTSFLIKEKTAVTPNVKIAKVDMILDYTLPLYADGVGYALIAMWENAADEYRGCEFYLKTPAEMVDIVANGYNYVQFGTVEITGGLVTSNTTTGMTGAGMSSGLLGYSGYSGYGPSGFSGEIGQSGFSGFSGFSGEAQVTTSGYSGFSGYSGNNPGSSGFSGFSGYSSSVLGVSGYSGWSGTSGLTGSECILLSCSDEITPLTTGTKVTFRMPYAMTLLYGKIKATLTTAGSTSTIVDVRKNGFTVFSSLPTLAATVKTTSVAPGTGLSTTSLADDDEITILVNTAGTGATGLKLYIIGNKS